MYRKFNINHFQNFIIFLFDLINCYLFIFNYFNIKNHHNMNLIRKFVFIYLNFKLFNFNFNFNFFVYFTVIHFLF